MNLPGDVLVLTGPTGSGKSELGVTLAERAGKEIISMDSMAVYRRLDIGTAKPTAQQRRRVRHHLIDVLEPWESASVAWWLKCAHECAAEICSRGKGILLVGGTPLYLKALVHGLFAGPPADPEIRARLEAEAQSVGPSVLHRRLASVDPLSAGRLHPNDRRRLIRALEVWELTGRPISAWQTQWPAAGADQADRPTILCLERPRAELYARIDRRVEQMFELGLVEEVRRLSELARPPGKQACGAVGIRETLAYLAGAATLRETISRIQTRTRNFARRQLTWFRHWPECQPASAEAILAARIPVE